MSHDLNEENGTVSFFANSENGLPWHGLGQIVKGAKSWSEAMKLANMNWEVVKEPLIHPFTNEQLPDVYGIFRTDNNVMLGTVGNVYYPIQNKESFQFVDSLLEAENGCHFDTAGVLGKGERIFCSAKVPFEIAPNRCPDDKTGAFLMFTNSHDGKTKASAKLTTIRVVCNNTLNMAMNDEGFGELTVKHSKRAVSQMEAAKKALQNTRMTVESLQKKFSILADRKLTSDSFSKCMESLWGSDWNESKRKKNVSVQVSELFQDNDGNAFPEVKGSAYNLLQAVTNYVDHYKTVKMTDNKSGMTEELVRTENAVFGANSDFKTQAIDKILNATQYCTEMPKKTSVVNSINLDNILNMVDA
jgi:phage/plasmid-like protein (TIGR03299 family)